MSFKLRVCRWLAITGLACAAGVPFHAAGAFAPQASEYAVVETLGGDQLKPQVSLGGAGGYIVWQDNFTDGSGYSVVARRLNASLSGQWNSFRVNQQAQGDQENPQIVLNNDGGAVIVFEGSQTGNKDIYAAFLRADGTFATVDVRVNTTTNEEQVSPAVACLQNGNIVVVWESFEQDGSYRGVYGRVFTSLGTPVGDEFTINSTTAWNQRTAAVAALANGNFAVTWVSELQRGEQTVDVYARVFGPTGLAVSEELLVNTATNTCGHPSLTAINSGGFLIAWSQKSPTIKDSSLDLPENSWDVVLRRFAASGKPQSAPVRVNGQSYGDQYAPKISMLADEGLVVWTSLAQDGSREGVYGRYVTVDGALNSAEFRVNTTTISQQLQPAVANDGASRFLVVWSSFTGLDNSFDLFAQRYATELAPLAAASAPVVSALSQSKLSVTWPPLEGYVGVTYELYIDGASSPVQVTSNLYTLTGLVSGSGHTFSLGLRLADGRVSPRSTEVAATTWGEDENGDGLPDDWQRQFWGANSTLWAASNADTDGDGVSNWREFLAGTNPQDISSVLKSQIQRAKQVTTLSWNTQSNLVYQVQVSTNFNSWSNLGAPRFAPGASDAVPVDGSLGVSYYRVIRVR